MAATGRSRTVRAGCEGPDRACPVHRAIGSRLRGCGSAVLAWPLLEPMPHAAPRLLPHGHRDVRDLLPRPARRRAGAVAGESVAADRRHQPRQVLLRSHRPRVEPRRLLARLLVDLRRVGDDRRGARPRRGRSRSRCASRCPRRPCRSSSRSATRANAFREVWSHAGRSGGHVHRPRRAAVARAGDRAAEERRPGDQGRSAHSRRRLHRRRAARSSRRTRGGSSTSCLRLRALQGAQVRLQRLGPVSAAAESGISRPSTGRHRRSPVGATYDAFGSERYVLTFDNRAFRDAAVVRAVRRRRDPRERPDVRRRRHLQPLRDRRRRQRLGAVCLRPRVRPPLRRARRRVLHVRRGLPARRRSRRAVGAERHRAARSRAR